MLLGHAGHSLFPGHCLYKVYQGSLLRAGKNRRQSLMFSRPAAPREASGSRPSSLTLPYLRETAQGVKIVTHILHHIYRSDAGCSGFTSSRGSRTWVHCVLVCMIVPNPACRCRRLCQLLPHTSLLLVICSYHDIYLLALCYSEYAYHVTLSYLYF